MNKTIDELLKELSDDCKTFAKHNGYNPQLIEINSKIYDSRLAQPFAIVLGQFGIMCIFRFMQDDLHYIIR